MKNSDVVADDLCLCICKAGLDMFHPSRLDMFQSWGFMAPCSLPPKSAYFWLRRVAIFDSGSGSPINSTPCTCFQQEIVIVFRFRSSFSSNFSPSWVHVTFKVVPRHVPSKAIKVRGICEKNLRLIASCGKWLLPAVMDRSEICCGVTWLSMGGVGSASHKRNVVSGLPTPSLLDWSGARG